MLNNLPKHTYLLQIDLSTSHIHLDTFSLKYPYLSFEHSQ